MTYIRKIIDVEQDGDNQRVKTIESDYPAVVDYAKFETGELVFHIRGGVLVPPMIVTKLGDLEQYNQNLFLVERDSFVRVKDLFPAGAKGIRLVEDQDRDNRILYDTLLGIEQIPEEDIEELDLFELDAVEPTIDVVDDTHIETLPDIDLSDPVNEEYWDLSDLRAKETDETDAVYQQAIDELYSRNDSDSTPHNEPYGGFESQSNSSSESSSSSSYDSSSSSSSDSGSSSSDSSSGGSSD